MKNSSFSFHKQLNKFDCAPACLMMLLDIFDVDHNYTFERLRTLCNLDEEGTSLENLKAALFKLDFRSSIKLSRFSELKSEKLPLILFFHGNHYVVLYKIKKEVFYVSDPSIGKIKYSAQELKKGFLFKQGKGILLTVEKKGNKKTILDFDNEGAKPSKVTFRELFKQVLVHKKGVVQILFTILITLIIQFTFPFLTSSIIDEGIENKDIRFIIILLIAQITLFISKTLSDFLRKWMVLHIGLRINLGLSNAFAKSILNKKLAYFQNKKEGDFLQRNIDNRRVEDFFTNTSISMLMGVLSFFTFGIVLMIFSLKVFLIFIVAAILTVLWVCVFIKKRKIIDDKLFNANKRSRSELLELINGVEEIRLNSLEEDKLKDWDRIQEKLLCLRLDLLRVAQYQRAGALGINQIKDILIMFFSSLAVMNGHMTIGELIAIQIIVGQLNMPLKEIINFIQNQQDASLSLKRISDIIGGDGNVSFANRRKDGLEVSSSHDIRLQKINVHLNGKKILKDIDMEIPFGSKVGIVGKSGSGKTTLLKTMLKLYDYEGTILVGENNLKKVDPSFINETYSTVSHESHIFSDTLMYNITFKRNKDKIDHNQLVKALEFAELKKITKNLPLGLNTNIGKGGTNLSRGQKQRVIIARAIYKNTKIFVFDEFVNFLDFKTKNKILDKVYNSFRERTIVSVSHNYEDLINCDYLYYIENGRITKKISTKELTRQSMSIEEGR